MLAISIPSAHFVALDVEEREGGSRPIWWRVIRSAEGAVRTDRLDNNTNDIVTDLLYTSEENVDVVAEGVYTYSPVGVGSDTRSTFTSRSILERTAKKRLTVTVIQVSDISKIFHPTNVAFQL